MDTREYVAQAIRDLRTNYGKGELSQEALAKELEVNTNTVSRWETGTYRPSIEDLEKIARFFGVSITTFFPTEKASEDVPIKALLRAAKDLPETDIEELRRYAEFRRTRSLYAGGTKPRVGRKRKTKSE